MAFDLVVLADRLPYPPVGGDRHRMYHVCRYLSGQGLRLHLLAFARSEAEAELARTFPTRNHFASIRLIPLNRTLAAAQVFMTFFSRDSMQLRYHYSRAMERELDRIVREVRPGAILCHLIRMAPYAKPFPKVRRVLEMIDVFSEYYARSKRVVRRRGLLVYSVEEPRIRKAEKEALGYFDGVVLIAPREKELLEKRYPEYASKLHVLQNGAPEDRLDAAAPPIDRDRVVFHGFLGYPPNRDAALYFATEVFPVLRATIPALKFQIVGAEPDAQLLGLRSRDGIEVTGAVDDVAPYVSGALASVCPLRAAAGLQNKVLESMAWGTPVVCTPAANSGVGATPGVDVLIAESAEDWLRHLRALRQEPALRARLSEAGRALIRDRFIWAKTLGSYPKLLGL